MPTPDSRRLEAEINFKFQHRKSKYRPLLMRFTNEDEEAEFVRDGEVVGELTWKRWTL